MRLRVGSRAWVVLLAALTGMTALSIDMSLPAQPSIARELGVTSAVAQLSLSLFLLGFACSQLVFGLLSDALGRKPALFCGLLIFTLAAITCTLSRTIELLLIARFVQGFGTSAAPVVARAMVRDTHDAAGAARALSTIMAVLAIAPMLAPVAGGVLLRLGWHAIFGVLAALGVVLSTLAWFGLDETLPPARRTPLAWSTTLRSLLRFLRAPGTLLPTALVCVVFVGQFAFISSSPFVLIDHFKVSPAHYGFYFGATASMLMVGSITGRHLLRRRAPLTLLRIGAGVSCLGGVLVPVGLHWPQLGAMGLIAPLLVYFVGIGMIAPSATAIAMAPVPDIAGLASAVIGSLQMASGALSGYLVTRIGGADPHFLGIVLASAGVVLLVLVALPVRAVAPS